MFVDKFDAFDDLLEVRISFSNYFPWGSF